MGGGCLRRRTEARRWSNHTSLSHLEACATRWNAGRLEQALAAYFAEHERICLEPNARKIRQAYVMPAEDKRSWRMQQMLVDPQELIAYCCPVNGPDW